MPGGTAISGMVCRSQGQWITSPYELANLLVGNDPGAACLEATIAGPAMVFTDETTVAVTGADMGPQINGQGIPLNTAVICEAGRQAWLHRT